MSKPPYPGQGTDMPDDRPYRGQWVIEGKVFLFRTDPAGVLGDFIGFKAADGAACDGFDLDGLADLMNLMPDELDYCNRHGMLMVIPIEQPPARDGFVTIEYLFKTPYTGTGVTIDRPA